MYTTTQSSAREKQKYEIQYPWLNLFMRLNRMLSSGLLKFLMCTPAS